LNRHTGRELAGPTGARYWRAADLLEAQMDPPTRMKHNTWSKGDTRGWCALDAFRPAQHSYWR
jgi:hypothetical protein